MTMHHNERHEEVVSDSPSIPPILNADAEDEAKSTPQVLVVRDIQELSVHIAAWEELAAAATEANVFYEPWMLLPAIEAFGAGHNFEFYLVFAAGRGPQVRKPKLNGIFPMERCNRIKGLPAQALTLWKHDYCMLCTPLIRRGDEAETLHVLLEHFATASDAPAVLEWNYLSDEGPIYQALTDVLNHRQTLTYLDETWLRAFLRTKPNASGEDYMRVALSGKRRKEFKRKENRLFEEGDAQYNVLEPFDAKNETDPYTSLDQWQNEFLRLEASGWKGEEGSAFASNPSHREFFCTVTKAAYERGRLDMLALRLNGRSLASKCNFLAGDGAFAFKIGYDEDYSRFSPGVLLEVEGIKRVHANPSVNWMDSCAIQDHSMINRLWTERRTLKNIVIATGRGSGEFIVSALPLLRWLKRKLRPAAPSKTQVDPQNYDEVE